MGRFWQSRILAEWNEAFAHLPIENMIWEHQSEYYKAIQDSTENNDSGTFIEFMLTVILEAIRQNPFVTQEELSKIVGITAANINLNMKKLQQAGIIKRIGADKNGKWEVI